MQPKVSIIIPVYNGEKYIKDSIRSMKAQTYANVEVIYVDDGSTDRTGEILDEVSGEDDRFCVIHKENQGVSAARNTGLARAAGEYLIFFDADDMVEKDVIKDNIELAVRDCSDVVMYGFWYCDADRKTEKKNEFPVAFHGSREEFFAQYLTEAVEREFFNAPWNKLIRRNLILENGICFDMRYSLYEDNLFAAELFIRAERITINPKAYYRYYLRASGSLLTSFHEDIFEGLTVFYDRAVEYCKAYPEHEEQIRSFEKMYVRHTYTFLKQISCNQALSGQQKRGLMQEICKEDRLLSALDHVKLQGRKKVMRYLIRNKRYRMMEMLYCAISRFADGQGRKEEQNDGWNRQIE